MTLTRREARELLDRHGLAPSRALGQNFLVDPNTIRRIVRLAEVQPGDPVVEIGAGLGSLTLGLADAGAEVTAVEIDRHLLPALREVVEPRGVRVVAGDALALDWAATLAGHDRWSLVANLPYNVATPLVCDLLDEVPAIDAMLVMVQREVAERLAAQAGDDAYGIPSVKVAYWATARVVGRVPPTVFLPQPRVESALVRIERRPGPGRRCRPGAVVRPGADRLRPAAQDAAPLTGRCGRSGRLRAGGHPPGRPPGGAHHRGLGPTHRRQLTPACRSGAGSAPGRARIIARTVAGRGGGGVDHDPAVAGEGALDEPGRAAAGQPGPGPAGLGQLVAPLGQAGLDGQGGGLQVVAAVAGGPAQVVPAPVDGDGRRSRRAG